MPHNIVLIGFMGSGKSTVGKLIAELLGWTLVDTDALVVRLAGCSIPEQFAAENGEAAFRERESQIVLGISAGEHQVIATGGGVPLREDNAAALRGAGKVVWLTARPEIVVRRTASRRIARPLLDTAEEEPLTRVLRMMGERGPIYQRVAELVVDTSDRPPIAVAREIIRRTGLGSPS
jgi:shikimate kinase